MSIGPPNAQSVGQWIIMAIVIAGIIAVMLVILGVLGISIPPFIVTICWIVVAVLIGAAAIKFLMKIMSA